MFQRVPRLLIAKKIPEIQDIQEQLLGKILACTRLILEELFRSLGNTLQEDKAAASYLPQRVKNEARVGSISAIK